MSIFWLHKLVMHFVIRYGYGTIYMISKRKHKRFLHFVRYTPFGLREGEMTNKVSCRAGRSIRSAVGTKPKNPMIINVHLYNHYRIHSHRGKKHFYCREYACISKAGIKLFLWGGTIWCRGASPWGISPLRSLYSLRSKWQIRCHVDWSNAKRRHLKLIKIAVLRHMGSFDYALREDRMTVW